MSTTCKPEGDLHGMLWIQGKSSNAYYWLQLLKIQQSMNRHTKSKKVVVVLESCMLSFVKHSG